MSADNQQERPNFRLNYVVDLGDLCRDHRKYDFHAQNDNEAHKKAEEHLRDAERQMEEHYAHSCIEDNYNLQKI